MIWMAMSRGSPRDEWPLMVHHWAATLLVATHRRLEAVSGRPFGGQKMACLASRLALACKVVPAEKDKQWNEQAVNKRALSAKTSPLMHPELTIRERERMGALFPGALIQSIGRPTGQWKAIEIRLSRYVDRVIYFDRACDILSQTLGKSRIAIDSV